MPVDESRGADAEPVKEKKRRNTRARVATSTSGTMIFLDIL